MRAATRDHLGSTPLFQGMTDRALDALSELAEEAEFPAARLGIVMALTERTRADARAGGRELGPGR